MPSPNAERFAAPRVRRLWRAHGGFVVLLALYLSLGITYSLTTPLFEASDELWHYPFVKRLADGQGLPVQHLDRLGPWRQEGSQPPLYYALGALLTCWLDTGDVAQVRWLNPHADIGIPTADGNVNMVIHTARERFPYRGTVLAMRLVRWFSVLLGAVTVWAGYLLAREIFPRDDILALGATGLTAFNAMFLFITSSVNNDALVMALSALGLWLAVRYVAGRPSWAQWALLGAVLGLGSIAKASALGLLPLAALAVTIVARRERSWSAFLRGGLAVGLPMLLLGGWWYVRNWRLYGDPTGLAAFVAIVGARYPVPTFRQLLGEWKGFVMSYWGFFGGMNVPAPGWFYVSLSLFGLAGLAGVPVFLWRAQRSGNLTPERRWQLGLVMLWPLIVFISLVRWTLMTIASQGRLMFSALTALSLLMALGLTAWLPRRLRGLLVGAMGLLLLISAALLPWITIRPAYAPPQPLDAEGIPASATPVGATFGGRMRLLAYQLDREQAAPGETIAITLYWQALQRMDRDYSVFVHLLREHDLIIAQRDRYPGRGLYPTSLWSPGEIIADTYVLAIPATALTPAEAQCEVGLYELASGARLPVVDAAGGAQGDNVRLGRIRLPLRQAEGIPNPVHFNLGNQAALVGYTLDRVAAAPGESFRLTLYWRALRNLNTNYSVFTQVLGAGERIWAQQDGWPQGGNAPTATWRKGQLIQDPYELVVRADAPPGVYDLQVGMYDAAGRRLSLLGAGGYVQDNRILLGQVRILPRQSGP